MFASWLYHFQSALIHGIHSALLGLPRVPFVSLSTFWSGVRRPVIAMAHMELCFSSIPSSFL
ncbi:hypothetical protein HBI56_143410 [Parastagonospora nodorum]|uniref:Uncharacterized protein n=1 Tax=Phaeosphaeria nodorum (strain SN15 / ATCC MYA-4574 / FGSC 10173) TaxID=321614 RepID=A0A7U2FC26_PHANO|nr:hypothetical protein HBH56_033640 [Parastagonospora nodorum]QRD00221.1 hypothetical protein JI435_414810 [Parastagonospora nodorum SN15]KAH3933458.1 hypothetical protein HBH54_065790 [Parastagonospora nodorum]KAH3952347.1 hypothetical protein HBH53_044240 [Parastagonospora nodorum]KAH3979559.1 hypothetical protein HBH51_055280 [Parastagonospora nodorum]